MRKRPESNRLAVIEVPQEYFEKVLLPKGTNDSAGLDADIRLGPLCPPVADFGLVGRGVLQSVDRVQMLTRTGATGFATIA
jgi:hypothetical protein